MLKRIALALSLLLAVAVMRPVSADAASAGAYPYQFQNLYTNGCLDIANATFQVASTNPEAKGASCGNSFALSWRISGCTGTGDGGAYFYGCTITSEANAGCLYINADYSGSPVFASLGLYSCPTWNVFPGEGAHVLQSDQYPSLCLQGYADNLVLAATCGVNFAGVPEQGWHWMG